MIPGAFPILAGGAQKSIVFQEARHSSADATSFTFTDVNLGYADPTRLIVIGVNYYKYDTSVNLNSVVVGSSTATSLVTRSEGVPGGTGSFIYSNISAVSVGTGLTATVTLTFSGKASAGCSIGVWSLYNLQSTTPVSTQTSNVSAGAASISFTTQVEDIICGVLTGADSAGLVSWTNITEQYDTVLKNITRSGASAQIFSSGSLSITGQNTSGQSVLVGAQFR